MGMTDNQFKEVLKLLRAMLKDAQEEKEPEKRDKKLEEVLKFCQQILKD